MNPSQMQEQIESFGAQIFKNADKAPSKNSFFRKDWWYGQIMEWSMKSDDFKVNMFRFVDVLPTLDSGTEVTRHIKEYFDNSASKSKGFDMGKMLNAGMGMGALAPNLMAKTIKKNVQQMAKMFITGESPEDALPTLLASRKKNIGFTVDLLGEATLSEEEALDYQKRYLELIHWLADQSQSWAANEVIDTDHWGAIPKVNVSVKLTALYSQIKETAWSESIAKLKERIYPLLDLAIEKNVFVNIDMESYHYKDLTFAVFYELLMEPKYKDYPHFGIVLQAYLRDSKKDLETLVQFAKKRNCPFSIRLVKGAYWDYETIHSQQNNWPIPVFSKKAESDANYEECARLLLDNYKFIKSAFASHNVRSLCATICYARGKGIADNAYEIQMLYGMADELKAGFAAEGFRMREYATVGDLIPGMAYLVRRLLENTSNESFLKSKFVDQLALKELLKDPKQGLEPTPNTHPAKGAFTNHPPLDFTLSEPREKIQKALNHWMNNLGKTYPAIVDHKPVETHILYSRQNPSNTREIVGSTHFVNTDIAEAATQSAHKAFVSWATTPWQDRVNVIKKLAQLIERDRYELAALEVLEVGKTWKEADGDIIEAIDFCNYYAHSMQQLATPIKVGHAMGEASHYHYIPRGVSLVVAPWNFPLAILTGMVAASLVTGNTVLIKPAEQSSIIAHELMKLLIEAGVPKGVAQFLPGYGEEVGEYLTSHPLVQIVSFTGSKEVGLNILNKSAQVMPGQQSIKKCIIEMGGKNALIIDNDADLDEAVQSTIYSAFAFQGQKCSACSRVIVLEEVYDKFTYRLVEAAKSLFQGTAMDPQSFLGPVVDLDSLTRIKEALDSLPDHVQVAYQGPWKDGGHFVPPTILTGVQNDDAVAKQELFGPVLSVIKAKNIDEAITLANDTEFGLTGGVFSRSPGNIEKVKIGLQVGNLYINRSITGAIVERHPFGGLKMSGVGSKTGGPDYLRQYMDPKVITENTMRRGFAPAE